PTPPPPAGSTAAEATLQALGRVDAEGRPTPRGTRVARLPIGVREARALLDGAQRLPGRDAARLAAEVVAAISDDHRPSGADLPRLLQDLRAGRAPGTDRWRRERERLTSLAQQAVASRRPAAASAAPISAPSAAEQAGAVLALDRKSTRLNSSHV